MEYSTALVFTETNSILDLLSVLLSGFGWGSVLLSVLLSGFGYGSVLLSVLLSGFGYGSVLLSVLLSGFGYGSVLLCGVGWILLSVLLFILWDVLSSTLFSYSLSKSKNFFILLYDNLKFYHLIILSKIVMESEDYKH